MSFKIKIKMILKVPCFFKSNMRDYVKKKWEFIYVQIFGLILKFYKFSKLNVYTVKNKSEFTIKLLPDFLCSVSRFSVLGNKKKKNSVWKTFILLTFHYKVITRTGWWYHLSNNLESPIFTDWEKKSDVVGVILTHDLWCGRPLL